jgi:hypothetical protein
MKWLGIESSYGLGVYVLQVLLSCYTDYFSDLESYGHRNKETENKY